MSRRKLSRQQQWRIDKIQAEKAKRAARKDEKASAEDDAGRLGPEREGRIIAHFGRTLEVADNDHGLHQCHQRANIAQLVTGDRVIFRPGIEDNGVIETRLERTSTLERPDARGQLKPVAANVDRILIVFAAEPEPYPNLIDRYLVACEATGIQPVLVLNKTDLLPDDGGELMRWLTRYEALGYEILPASVKREHGLDALTETLDGLTTVFVGQSGVGKSSLIDALLPDELLRIGALSEDTRKGKHTTTTARLYRFQDGGELIDSPGIREFGLTHLSAQDITDGFVEFRPFASQCKFRDCHHEEEPGCALKAAVERGDIHPERFTSYQQIKASLDGPAY
ncbi:small ribosomal subunit biogenesis GTPase RsgA [Larsenimonas suaedae]|uniref:Small ribosomal subunit biogenesis GTPase RsgA n=1 Tax=Larsenimonas suaedae TaxID=1851019 RepID=A0ABU1GY39_9GAMM|nr:small ribosomal subunit biogenesis GTPase RsgA [Larsenimonas suaedae]MCM2972863.1 small ribosomal subunit biogenesis GTPase RsgA [Larsenimonas suaedae]MDR5896962.1 small ribosomal subunit biogenesis GTPase RsgA [Larsenimonas suaedae]